MITLGASLRAHLTVMMDGKTSNITVPAGQTLLQAAAAGGLDLPNLCQQGSCGACAARLLAGSVDMPHHKVLSKRDRDHGMILVCQAWPASAHLIISYDE